MPLPVVAIIGRPNVGKSTLFNRILRRRQAIVDDQPGVTRDRNYALADWAGRDFYLVDTGGLVPHSKDRLETAVKRQVEAAIGESDLLALVVDAKAGITDTDRHIAQLVRRRSTPHIVIVNKVDGTRDEPEVHQFFRLGLGQPHPASAASGRSIGDLLDEIVALLPQSADEPGRPATIRVAVLGKPNVGKSSLINAITGQERVVVDSEPGTTRDAVDTSFSWQGNHLTLVDTAGLRRKSKATEDLEFYTRLRTERSIEGAEVGILVLDSSQGLSHLDLTLAGMLDGFDRAAVVAINKWDLAKDQNQAQHLGWLRQQMPFLTYAEFVFTSAIQGQGIPHLLQAALSAHSQWRKRIEPELLTAAFEEAVRKYQPPAVRGKDVSLYGIRQARTRPPGLAVLTNQPKLIPESYQRYLVRSLRQGLGLKGTPLRIRFQLSKPTAEFRKRRYVEYGKRPRYRADGGKEG